MTRTTIIKEADKNLPLLLYIVYHRIIRSVQSLQITATYTYLHIIPIYFQSLTPRAML